MKTHYLFSIGHITTSLQDDRRGVFSQCRIGLAANAELAGLIEITLVLVHITLVTCYL
jgi:hypothetical protein